MVSRNRKRPTGGCFFPVAIGDAAFDRRNRYVRGFRLWRHAMYDFRGWEDNQVYATALDSLARDLASENTASVGIVVEDEEEG